MCPPALLGVLGKLLLYPTRTLIPLLSLTGIIIYIIVIIKNCTTGRYVGGMCPPALTGVLGLKLGFITVRVH
jgi:hypothetical protein